MNTPIANPASSRTLLLRKRRLWKFFVIFMFAIAVRRASAKVPVAPLSGMAGYSPPDSLSGVLKSKDLGKVLKLDYNEASVPPPKNVTEAITNYLHSVKGLTLPWYPHLSGSLLRSRISRFIGVPEDSIIVTNGSDDALRLIMDTYLSPGDAALVPQPSYPQVQIFIVGRHAKYVKLDMKDAFKNDEGELREAIAKHKPKVVYLISPNNPTGTEWAPELLRKFCTDYPDIVFIVDEAYKEFGRLPVSVADPAKYPNMIVSRTFSKCWGLAALRCGFIVANPAVVKDLFKLYNTKSVNEVAQIAAAAAIDSKDYYLNYAKEVCAARDWAVSHLEKSALTARSGGGNFFCVKMPDGVEPINIVETMAKKDVYIRDIHGRFPGYIRITAGTKAQMERACSVLLDSIAEIQKHIKK